MDRDNILLNNFNIVSIIDRKRYKDNIDRHT